MTPTQNSKERQRAIEIIRNLKITTQRIACITAKTIKSITGKFSSFFHFLWNIISVLAILSSLLIPIGTIYLSFSNFISIPPTHSLKANAPLTVPFVIQNNSFINLWNLVVDIQVVYLDGYTAQGNNITINNQSFGTFYISKLGANGKYTIIDPIPVEIGTFMGVTSIRNATIQLNVSYKALFSSHTESFRFRSIPTQNGIFEFYPVLAPH